MTSLLYAFIGQKIQNIIKKRKKVCKYILFIKNKIKKKKKKFVNIFYMQINRARLFLTKIFTMTHFIFWLNDLCISFSHFLIKKKNNACKLFLHAKKKY